MSQVENPNANDNPDGANEKISDGEIHNSSEFGITPSFGIEISGTLFDNVPVRKGLLGSLIQAINLVTVRPLQRVIINFIESRAEIQIMDDRAKRVARVEKFKNIAEVYNQAMFNADKISLDKPDMKIAYLETLRNDFSQQLKNLLEKDDW